MKVPLGYDVETYEPAVLNANEVRQNNNFLRQAFTERKSPKNNYFAINYPKMPIYYNNIVPNNNLVYTSIVNNNVLDNKYINTNYTISKPTIIPLNYTANNFNANNNLKYNNYYNLYQSTQLNNQLISPNIKYVSNNNNNLFMPLVAQKPYNQINNIQNPNHHHHHKLHKNKSRDTLYTLKPQMLYHNNMPVYQRTIIKKYQ